MDIRNHSQTQSPVRFGCRMVAYMPASQPRDGQDRFLREILIEADNSLKRQAGKPSGAILDGVLSWEAATARVFDGISDDGWGIAAFFRDQARKAFPWIRRSANGAAQDPEYDRSVRQAVKKQPTMLMAHARAGRNVIRENAHPFRHDNWASMHNGTLEGAFAPHIKDVAERFKPSTGTTDTELVFHYLLHQMQQTFGTTDAARIPTGPLMETFRQVTREVASASRAVKPQGGQEPLRLNKLDAPGVRFDPGSRVRVTPAANLVLSDGERMLASRIGNKLYVGISPTGKGESDVLLASEPIQPKGGAKIQWAEIPNEHTLLLQRGPQGIELELKPL